MPWATPVDWYKQILCPCQPPQQAPGAFGEGAACVWTVFLAPCASPGLCEAPPSLLALVTGSGSRGYLGERLVWSVRQWLGRVASAMGGEFGSNVKKAWGAPTPSGLPRPGQRQVCWADVLAHDSQSEDWTGDVSEPRVRGTGQRPCPDQGVKREGTQVSGARVLTPPPPTVSSVPGESSKGVISRPCKRGLLTTQRLSSSQVTREVWGLE